MNPPLLVSMQCREQDIIGDGNRANCSFGTGLLCAKRLEGEQQVCRLRASVLITAQLKVLPTAALRRKSERSDKRCVGGAGKNVGRLGGEKQARWRDGCYNVRKLSFPTVWDPKLAESFGFVT